MASILGSTLYELLSKRVSRMLLQTQALLTRESIERANDDADPEDGKQRWFSHSEMNIKRMRLTQWTCRAGGRSEGDFLLLGAFHFDHVIDRRSLRQLHATAQEDSSSARDGSIHLRWLSLSQIAALASNHFMLTIVQAWSLG